MGLLDRIDRKEEWLRFYEYKEQGGHLSDYELKDLKSFIDQEEYHAVIRKIREKEGFSYPKATILNKKNTNKKRVVFLYEREENYILKILTYLCMDYDSILTSNLYSFRRGTGVKKAIDDIRKHTDIDVMCSYKVDIHDYFNSVDVELLLPMLKKVWINDTDLYDFVEGLLRNPYVYYKDTVCIMKKGIMAGVPISAFLANIYLMELDRYFAENHILYARYSDDIIVFAKSKQELEVHIQTIKSYLDQYHLTINPKKEVYTCSGDGWEFLGFFYHNGKIDVSKAALQKIKGKLKRKSRAIFRWKVRNQKLDEYAIRAYIKYFNRKFFDNPIKNETTWCKWYFPIINTDETLHEIDSYTQSCIRYLVTGRYTKANYNLRYETMKELGYRSLVNAYHRYRCNGKDRTDQEVMISK